MNSEKQENQSGQDSKPATKHSTEPEIPVTGPAEIRLVRNEQNLDGARRLDVKTSEVEKRG